MKILLTLLFSILITPVYAENYFYFEEHKLSSPPEFCIIKFDDPLLPGSSETLYQITQNSIQDWEDKLVRYTGEKQGWDFTSRIISKEEYNNIFSDAICDITIYFEREPTTEEEKTTAGHTYAMFGFADITIFYLEPVWIFEGRTETINGEIYEIANISHYKNSLDPYNNETIKHEIGHALGLDHYPAKNSEIVNQTGISIAPSIMTLAQDDILVDRLEITEYDIRSVVNLYGEDGINEPDGWAFLDYFILGVLALVIFFLVRRKFHKKPLDFVKLIPSTKSKLCIRCNETMSKISDCDICDSCLKKDDFGI